MPSSTKKRDLLALLGRRWVTPIVALQSVGIMSLSQRVSEWRRQGLEFDQRTVLTDSGARVAAYRLRARKDGA
jgi:hypothetical protein